MFGRNVPSSRTLWRGPRRARGCGGNHRQRINAHYSAPSGIQRDNHPTGHCLPRPKLRSRTLDIHRLGTNGRKRHDSYHRNRWGNGPFFFIGGRPVNVLHGSVNGARGTSASPRGCKVTQINTVNVGDGGGRLGQDLPCVHDTCRLRPHVTRLSWSCQVGKEDTCHVIYVAPHVGRAWNSRVEKIQCLCRSSLICAMFGIGNLSASITLFNSR